LKIAIIGQGYVGLSLAMAAASKSEVIGFDHNRDLVNDLSKGISHIEGVASKDLKNLASASRYEATSDFSRLAEVDVVIIAVPTPLNPERKPDLSYIEQACGVIGQYVNKPVLIINESTSHPGTLRNFIKPAIERYSQQGIEHRYAVAPERVNPGNSEFIQKNTPRIVAGLTVDAAKEARAFYSQFCGEIVEVSTPEVAEAAKLFENTFRQVNIALVNEFAQISHALGVSVHEVLEAANSKPFGFMKFNPSAGVGGHCIPVDPTYLAAAAESHGASAALIRLSNNVNMGMAQYVVDRVVADHSGSIAGKSVLVVGVSYKANVKDVRETAAARIIECLRNQGAVVSWHDPLVQNWNGESSGPLLGADIAIVVTKHDSVEERDILASAPYIFDTTGTIKGAKGF
jgi:UDP-N-acetyl-D-glucosamine dehydrogenase